MNLYDQYKALGGNSFICGEIEEMKKNPEAYKAYSNAEDMVADILHEI